MRQLLLAGVCLLTLATSCGSAASGAPPTVPPTSLGQLTVADGGRTILMHVGDSVEVALMQQPGFSEWSHPSSTNPAVIAPQVDPRAAAVRGMTLASFRATARGTADLQSASGAACSPGVACPAIARAWQVHVTVS